MNKQVLNQPLVSVGIPSYNRPAGLRSALDCVVNQTYKNLEIIVSDNCSTNTAVLDILNEYAKKDFRITYVIQERNIGPLANFEFVTSAAKGEYFFWAADDDLCEPDFVKKIIAKMQDDKNIVLCACDVKAIDFEGKEIGAHCLESIRPETDWKIAKKMFFEYPTSNVYLCIYGIYKINVLRDCGLSVSKGWKNFCTNGEVPFLARISTHGKIVAIPETLKSYRTLDDSVYSNEISGMSSFDVYMIKVSVRVKLYKIVFFEVSGISEKLIMLYTISHSWINGINFRHLIAPLVPKNLKMVIKKMCK